MLPYLRDTVNSAYGRFLARGHERGQGLIRDINMENPKPDNNIRGLVRWANPVISNHACSNAVIELDINKGEADVSIAPMVPMHYVIMGQKG